MVDRCWFTSLKLSVNVYLFFFSRVFLLSKRTNEEKSEMESQRLHSTNWFYGGCVATFQVVSKFDFSNRWSLFFSQCAVRVGYRLYSATLSHRHAVVVVSNVDWSVVACVCVCKHTHIHTLTNSYRHRHIKHIGHDGPRWAERYTFLLCMFDPSSQTMYTNDAIRRLPVDAGIETHAFACKRACTYTHIGNSIPIAMHAAIFGPALWKTHTTTAKDHDHLTFINRLISSSRIFSSFFFSFPVSVWSVADDAVGSACSARPIHSATIDSTTALYIRPKRLCQSWFLLLFCARTTMSQVEFSLLLLLVLLSNR